MNINVTRIGMTLDFETDQFLKLLTDALRAGPGSPSWHEAVLRLQAGQEGAAGADEYRLLCEARTHLESGKEYRSIRAGPGFTRSVMDAIASESMAVPKRFSTTNLVALIAGLLLTCAVSMFIYLLVAKGNNSGAQSEAIDALTAKLLGNAVTSLAFDQSPPADWKIIGQLPLEFSSGMRPKSGAGKTPDFAAGGLVWQTPLTPSTPFEVEAILKVSRSTENLLPEIAISDENDFNQEKASASHEFVWLLQSGQAQVIAPSGRIEAQSDVKGPHNALTIRLRFDDRNAIVEMDGKRVWTGASGLAPDKPRYIAVRLLRRGNNKQDLLSLQSVRVLTGQ